MPMTTYIITEDNLSEYTSSIIGVYADKIIALRDAKKLNNEQIDPDIEYRVQSFVMNMEKA